MHGAHEIGGLDRTDEEIGDLELDEDPHGSRVELLRDDEDRRLALEPTRDALQRLDLLELGRIHVDDAASQLDSWISPRSSTTFLSTVISSIRSEDENAALVSWTKALSVEIRTMRLVLPGLAILLPVLF